MAAHVNPSKEGFVESVMLDAAGHRRSPATMPSCYRGPPHTKGEEYPADPPTVEEIVAVMRTVGDRPEARRLRALIVLLWRAGLRISEALAVQESDLDRRRGAVLVRRGKGGKWREVGISGLDDNLRADPAFGAKQGAWPASASRQSAFPTRKRRERERRRSHSA